MHPNVTFFAESEHARAGSTTMVSEWHPPVAIEARRLTDAFRRLVERHEALRCGIVRQQSFDHTDREAWWTSYRLEDQAGVDVAVERTTEFSPVRALRPFAIHDPPLARLEVAPDLVHGQKLRLVTSHACCDGLSLGILWRDLTRILAEEHLPPIARGYREHLASEQARWRSGGWLPALRYWRSHLAGYSPEPLPAPPGKLSKWPAPKATVLELDRGEYGAFQRLQGTMRTTPFATGVALLALAEREVFGWKHATFVTPVANRYEAHTWHMAGLFANLVQIRAALDSHPADVFRAVRSALLRALAHGYFPLFLLRSEMPEIAEALDAGPRVAVRQPEPNLPTGVTANSEFGEYSESRRAQPANDYGLGNDLLADFFFGHQSAVLRLTYRADKLHDDTARDLVSAFRLQLS